ncbi:MAG: hypothetical protein JST53_00530 [Actinobacteria bacterium]|nr:hypothetical protein [Actinomycetota bacterium]
MKRQDNRRDDFESRLLGQLQAIVAARGDEASRREAVAPAPRPSAWRRRAPRLALVGALALAAVAVALIITAGGSKSSTAFAVEPRPGGGVTIKIFSLEDASGVEAALMEAGIRSQVTWLDAGMVCKEPHYKSSAIHSSGGGTFGGMTMGGPGAITISVGDSPPSRIGEYKRGEISHAEFQSSLAERANLNLDPEDFRPDQTVIISGAPVPYDGDPEGGSITKFDVAEGKVEPCEPVPAPPGAGTNAFALTQEGGPGYTPRGDSSLPAGAAATALHRAAAAAGSSDTALAPPGPGKFLYEKTKVVELEGWLPRGEGKGPKDHPRYFVQINDPKARYALVPRTRQVWTAPSGKTHVRETLGRIRFLSTADQRAWEAAGSPPPWAFDPAEHPIARDASGRLEKDYPRESFRGRHEFRYLGRLARLPTESEVLRLKIEHRPSSGAPVAASPATSARGGGTVEGLLEILGEPLTPPAVRAAAFGALAEIPDLGFERGVTDGAGRRGDAIGWTREAGFGNRYIFDPRTGELLSDAEFIYDAKAADYPTVPDDTPFRETVHLRAAVVGTIR